MRIFIHQYLAILTSILKVALIHLSFIESPMGFLTIDTCSDLVNPLAGLSESFALFLVDLIKTLDSHLARFSISHTEHIVSLNSSINTAVAGDWLSKLHHCLCWVFFRNTIESSNCFCFRLGSNRILFSLNQGLSESFLCILICFLLLKGLLWRRTSVKCIFLRCKNWLLDIIKNF